MMGTAIAEVIPGALAMALVNPIPTMAVILLLLSPKSRFTAPAFLAGWVLGMIAIFGILLFVYEPEAEVGTPENPSVGASLVRIGLGVLLLVLGVRRFRSRPQEGMAKPMPGWMTTLEGASPPVALGVGAMLSALNPKNLAFIVAAVISIAQEDLAVGQKVPPVAVFVALASLGVVVPITWYLVAQERATTRLTAGREWLTANYALIMAIVFLLFGVILASRGIGDLIG